MLWVATIFVSVSEGVTTEIRGLFVDLSRTVWVRGNWLSVALSYVILCAVRNTTWFGSVQRRSACPSRGDKQCLEQDRVTTVLAG